VTDREKTLIDATDRPELSGSFGQLAACYAPQATSRWEAYLIGYQRMPDHELLKAEEVTLRMPLERLVSREGHRVCCAACGDEVFNERELMMGKVLCVVRVRANVITHAWSDQEV
jgi:formylmethanofuran dehydrogenase subunit E